MTVDDTTWHKVFERDHGRCRYCECDLLATFEHYYFAEVDHLLPRDDPNRDDVDNLVLACRACNGRLSRAHGLGHTTFESRKAYLQSPDLSRGTKEMYQHYLERKREGWR